MPNMATSRRPVVSPKHPPSPYPHGAATGHPYRLPLFIPPTTLPPIPAIPQHHRHCPERGFFGCRHYRECQPSAGSFSREVLKDSGKLKIDFHKDHFGLSIRLYCDSLLVAEFSSGHQDDLKQNASNVARKENILLRGRVSSSHCVGKKMCPAREVIF